MKYSFNLEWSELSEELREKKIDEHIAYLFENNDLEMYSGKWKTLDDALEDLHLRDEVEEKIQMYFPIYF